MNGGVGTPQLLRVSMRQDVHNIAPWVILISVLSASSILIYRWIFVTAEERLSLAAGIGLNPALSLIFGPVRDLTSADGFNAWRAGMLGALFAGLMAIFIVVRNSRSQEDSGQAELLASGVLGRYSRILAAMSMATVASTAVGVVSCLFTWLCGGELLASAALGATFAASGVVFGGVAAVTCQVAADGRSATSMAVGALAVLYVMRGYLDLSSAPGWTRWVTPFGWLAEVDSAGEANWRPLLAALGFALVLTVIAVALQSRRDFGMGMVPQGSGPAAGSQLRLSGLMASLHGGSLAGWFVALSALGALFGALVSSIKDLLATNPALSQLLASADLSSNDLSLAFIANILQIIGIITGVLGVKIVMRMYAEEVEHRAEPILATAVRRPVYLGANLAVAFSATAMAMLLAGLALGVVAHLNDESVLLGEVLSQAVLTVPAVWVLVALAGAAVGARPRRRVVGWGGVLATFGLTLLGPTFKLPEWALAISPLHHVPSVSAEPLGWMGLVWLMALTVLFLVIAFAGYRRRDIA